MIITLSYLYLSVPCNLAIWSPSIPLFFSLICPNRIKRQCLWHISGLIKCFVISLAFTRFSVVSIYAVRYAIAIPQPPLIYLFFLACAAVQCMYIFMDINRCIELYIVYQSLDRNLRYVTGIHVERFSWSRIKLK
jgi:hypothetical protein